MDSLINKPIYNFTKTESSQVFAHGRSNCCFISSFQIQMKKKFPNFPDLKTLLDLLYQDKLDAYTHFAHDFPVKWFQIKTYLINKNLDWIDKLENVLLQVCLPLKNQSKCVQLTFINLNTINIKEVNSGEYKSLEESFSDEYNPEKTIISIIQYSNHFEPIQVDFSTNSNLTSLDELGIDESFFN